MDCAGCLEARTRDRQMRSFASILDCGAPPITEDGMSFTRALEIEEERLASEEAAAEQTTVEDAAQQLDAERTSGGRGSGRGRRPRGPSVIVEQGRCNPEDDAQLWNLLSMDDMDIYYMFENYETGKCLATTGCDWCDDGRITRNLGQGGHGGISNTVENGGVRVHEEQWAFLSQFTKPGHKSDRMWEGQQARRRRHDHGARSP